MGGCRLTSACQARGVLHADASQEYDVAQRRPPNLRALEYLRSRDGAHVFNLGNGHGFSVLEVVRAIERLKGGPMPVQIEARRAGDPAVLVADSGKAQRELGWQPRYRQLDEILRSAWQWHSAPAY